MQAGGRRAVVACLISIFAFVVAPAHAAGRCGDHPWCDTSLSPDARAGLLLDALTRDEKISLLAGDSLSNRLNEIMKVLTIMASVFIPLTFLAGLYGMNFNPASSPWNMPELNWHWGYPAVLGIMAVVAAAMLVYFHRKGWI